MTRRLLLSYLGLAIVTLALLEFPLAILAKRHERDVLATQAQREATGLAVVTSEDLENHRFRDLAAVVAQYRSRTGGEVAVIDAGGTTVAASDSDHDNDAADQRSLVSSALQGRAASRYTTDEGSAILAAAVPVSSGATGQGAVLLELSATGTVDRVHDIWLALAGFAVAVLSLTALVGLWLARSISRPLLRLEEAVAAFGAGDLQVRAPSDAGPPNIRSLAGQFNRMATRLGELVDAQSRFVADASHQLRSPLTALRLRLENLEAGSDGPAGESLAAAGREVQRLSRLVDGLLALSGADRNPPERRAVDVHRVIEERCDAWAALAEERHVDLDADVSPYPAHAVLVPGDLDQILDNLLANALDASPPASRIRVRLVRAGANSAEVHVSDQGAGLNDEDRIRAFDRFWQGPGGKGGRSGLGLAIVRQLAIRNDAQVELGVAEGGGLEAVVTLTATSDRQHRVPVVH